MERLWGGGLRDDQGRALLGEPLWVFLVAREIFRILEGLSASSLKALGGSFLELYAAYEATGVALCSGRRVLAILGQTPICFMIRWLKTPSFFLPLFLFIFYLFI